MRPPLIFLLLAACAGTTAFAGDGTPAQAPAYTVERLELPGPVAGVAVKVNLRDARVRVQVALADERDPDGAGPAVGQLDTPSAVARKRDFDVTLNASYFAVSDTRSVEGTRVKYFTGNGGWPSGWHFSDGRLVSTPGNTGRFGQALVVHKDGAISIDAELKALPADTRYAVSGNRIVLQNGMPTPPENDEPREPRSAVGLSADGNTLILLAIDGRQPGYSRGVNMRELAQIFLDLGARSALNLDGGGSTSLVLKTPGSDTYAIANRPSDLAPMAIRLSVERPVVDVIGIRVAH